MFIQAIDHNTVADRIVEKLETMIVDGVLKPGDALPPERQLARGFSVSRATLRQAISALEGRGLINSRQGGGNYVCDVAKKSFADPLINLLDRHQDLKHQIIELRQSLEGTAAYYAAQRATAQDKQDIRRQYAALQAVVKTQTPLAEARADLDLHLAIADAAHNAPLTLMIRNIYGLLLKHIEEHLNLIHRHDATNQQLQSQHARLVEAVLSGDSIRARDIVYEHLDFVNESFRQCVLAEKRRHNSEMRRYLSNA